MRLAPRRAAVAIAAAAVLAASSAGCSKDSGSKEAFCAQVKRVPALESVLARFSEADQDVLADRIAKARDAYDQLADAAPSTIDDETDQVVSLVDDILDAVEQNPTDPAKASAQLRTAMAAHKGIDEDRAKVASYAEAQCGVKLDATLTDGGGSSSSSTTTTVAGPADGSSTTTTTG